MDARRGMFAAFDVRAFRWVWGAALSGNSGRFAVILVAGWEAYRLGGDSSVWPSLVMLLLLVPSMFLGLFAGGVADRRNRAYLAAAGQVVNAASSVAAGVLTLTGRLDLTILLALTGLIGVGNAIQGPAWQAMIPELVGLDRLLGASMITRIAQQGAELTGPAIGTLVLTSAGPGPAFLACAAFYLVALAMLWRIRQAVSRPASPRRAAGVLAPVVQGFAYIRGQPPIGTLLVWVGLHCGLTMASIGILPAVATANLHGDAGAYGLLLTSFGLGSVLGPLVLLAIAKRVRVVGVLVVSGVCSGLPLICLGLVHVLAVAVVSAALAGAAQAVFMAGIYSATQTVALEGMRGRVASVQLSLTTGAMGLASVGWGVLAGVLAPGVVLAAPGAAFVLACLPFIHRRRRIAAELGAHPAAAGSSAAHPAASAELLDAPRG